MDARRRKLIRYIRETVEENMHDALPDWDEDEYGDYDEVVAEIYDILNNLQ